MLPEGTIKKVENGYEKVTVPPSTPFDPEASGVKHIETTELPQWAQLAFKGTKKLNTIQSIVFNAAFYRSQNLLICAPTGAGKTNIAVLTILRLIGQHMDAAGGVGRDFKVIYMAPMKALVGEVVEKFSSRLGPLGIRVAECTGDMSLTKKELEETHVIVTVPEKWDVMTRNTVATGGANDNGLQKLVQLIIIDEIHLLNEDRGAIIETVVARSLRYQEVSGQPVRLVALSATLPNYADVAAFLRVDGEGLFHFDSSYRPIPLETSFIGATEKDHLRLRKKFDELAYEAARDQVRGGHQCMVFVHSRKETGDTAKTIHDMAVERGESSYFECAYDNPQWSFFKKEVDKSRNTQLRELFEMGLGMHNAGMLRSDRTLTERMFLAGVVRVLCCTATLAWGVNLPARTVIIKGTKIYDAAAGGFKDLGILDVQQIFGRAGRPGFDTEGSATLITSHDKLNHYLRQLLQQMPIDSKFGDNMSNSLNAEVAMGSVTSQKDAADWIRYTYMYVRMFRTPTQFGITDTDQKADPTLEKKRRELVNESAQQLNKAKLIRIDNNNNYIPTDLGRVAARFYIDWETAQLFSTGPVRGMSDQKILKLFGESKEFQQIQVRNEEIAELQEMMNDEMTCPVRVLGGAENVYGKVAILLQAYMSRRYIGSFSLVSDCNYILANASRLFRTLFEITMTRVTQMSEMSDRLLEWCKMVDQRLWQTQHVLRHFCNPPTTIANKTKGMSLDDGPKGGVLKEQIVYKLEEAGFDYWRLLSMQKSEIVNITGAKANADAVAKYLRRVPALELNAKIQPITSTIMRITLIITPDFDWSDRWSGPMESFYVWVEDPQSQDILHSEYYTLHKRNLYDKGQLSFAIPLQEPRPPQYIINVVSDRWVGVKFQHEFAVSHLLLPDRQSAHTPLLNLTPMPVTALHNPNFQRLYRFTHFNAIQTQVFHTCYHSDYNVLLGAPTGSGKTIVSELAMLRVFNNTPDEKVIYIAPLKALARERMEDWEERFQRQLGKTVVELTGDFTPDVDALERADVVVVTPEKWDGISRHWQHRAYVRKVGLIIIDEIHLLGQDRGPVLEVIVSRMRYISCNLDRQIRFVGLSTALANAHDIADWLGIGIVGLFNFKPSVRPVPMTVHLQGYPEKHYVPRMASMNKPCFHAIKNHAVKADGIKPTLIFVSSRRQTRLTALDIIAFMTSDPDEDPKQFCKMEPHEVEYAVRRLTDTSMKQTIEFGIGFHHAGLPERDRKVVEELFVEAKIMVLIATSTLAWGVNFPAHLVVVKGTEYYDGSLKRYVDFPITDVLQMMGRAGRPQFDSEARAVVMVHEPKKNFYRRFLYEPFPVESSLHEQLTDHLNAEICASTITTRERAIDYVTWTYFFRRLTANPAYYDQQAALMEDINFEKQRDMLASYIERLMNKCLDELIRSGCIELREGQPGADGEIQSAGVVSTKLGKIASLYYLGHRTVAQFQRTLQREGLSFVQIMRVLCECPEYDELPVRHNEDKLNAEFAEHCPLEVDLAIQAYDSPHTKAFLLLQAHMWGLALPINDYKTDLKSVLDRSIPLIQAMVDIAAEEGQLKSTVNLILLLQCLHQATHPWRSSLACMPHFSDKTLKILKGQGIECLPELIERRDYTKLLSQLALPTTGDAYKEVLQLLNGLPKLRMRIELRVLDPEDKKEELEPGGEGEKEKKKRKGRLVSEPYRVPPDSELELTVVLQYENQPLKFVHAPRFPKKKTFSWWCILGDTEVDELVAIKKSILPTKAHLARRVNFQFCSPAEEVGETFTLSVVVMSDSYFGLDQQIDLSITTEEA
jgi:activating signal cointegrator complex subunit 3